MKLFFYHLNSSHDGVCIIGDIYRTNELQISDYDFFTVDESNEKLQIPSVAYINGESYPVTEIGDFAFKHFGAYYRNKLTNVILPDSLKTIGESAFSNLKMLTSIVLPNSLAKIGSRAFSGCERLQSIIIPNSVKEIGEGAFNSCYSLNQIIILNSVVSIKSFAYCPCISSVYIGQGVTSIDSSAFLCSSIEQFEVDSQNVKYDSRNGCNAIIETDTNTLILASQNTVIPDSVAIIGESAFYYHEDLQVISIPKSVMEIKENAFKGCENIKEVHYEGTLDQWEKIIFKNKYSNPLYYTKKLIIDGELNYIHDKNKNFVDIQLFMKEVSFLEDPRLSLLNFDLYENSIRNKKNFYINLAYLIDYHKKKSSTWTVEIKRFLDSIFEIDGDINRLLYADAYFTTLKWEVDTKSEFPNWNKITNRVCASHIELLFLSYYDEKVKGHPNGLISNSMSFNHNDLSDWFWSWFDKSKLEKEIQNENKRSFINAMRYGMGAEPLKETPRHFSSTMSNINRVRYQGLYYSDTTQSVVVGCVNKNTESLVIPKTVKRIGKFAFHQCRKLTSMNIPDSVEVIDWFAFAECDSLVSVTIPDSVKEIGLYAFHYCRNLDTIKMSKKAYDQCGASIPDEVPYPSDEFLKLKKKKIQIVLEG